MASGESALSKESYPDWEGTDRQRSEDERQGLLDLPAVKEIPQWKKILRCECLGFIPQRFKLCLLAHLGFFHLYVMRGNFSVAILPMVQNSSSADSAPYDEDSQFNWSLKEQSYLHSAFFYGYLLTQVLGGFLASKYGGVIVFGFGLCLSSIVTFLTPLASHSYYVLLIARFLCGLFQGVTYPAMHVVWSRWAPPSERSRLATFAYSGAYFGLGLITALFEKLTTQFGWQYIFYFSGVSGMIVQTAWYKFVYETPEEDPNISNDEKNRILLGISQDREQLRSKDIPWKNIFCSSAVWAICLAHFAANWGFYLLLTELPTFLSSAVHYDMAHVASTSWKVFVVMGISIVFGGFFSDALVKQNLINLLMTRRTFICGSFIMQVLLYITLANIVEDDKIVACLMGISYFAGISWAGFGVNHLDIAPKFAGVLFGMSNMVATLPGIISPILTGFIVEEGKIESWSPVFYLTGCIYVLAACNYMLFGTVNPQPWSGSDEKFEHQEIQ